MKQPGSGACGPRRAAALILLLLAAGAAAVPGGLSDPLVVRRKLPRRVAAQQQQQPAGAALLPTTGTTVVRQQQHQQQPTGANTTTAAQHPPQKLGPGPAAAQAQQAVPGTEEWRRPSVDCSEMENCKRCRRYQGCTSCTAGYTLNERDNGLGDTTYCADAFAGKSRDWLMAYPWVAYCAPYLGGMSQANCGKCLRMTSTRTGSQVIVRIVDMCGHGMIDSDRLSAFVPLDTDKGGYAAGHLDIKLELVAC
ncbi:pathogenesis-related PR-4-like [Chlorella sorokiniana]|uniref:Pathogenesis-related PR-4-like n=1 Tax=Chlorella sorokiniana TaxID=3076 RepID=A0A2P6TUQ3_CHLSO|nr:pathogenesis-related PR-4-like [Chlorella sorokiniana]|eukprot:PRW57802.1 pathogenesis-related PR-4-like [Chlorella sorokiniana]